MALIDCDWQHGDHRFNVVGNPLLVRVESLGSAHPRLEPQPAALAG
jgi:hypothetical protein